MLLISTPRPLKPATFKLPRDRTPQTPTITPPMLLATPPRLHAHASLQSTEAIWWYPVHFDVFASVLGDAQRGAVGVFAAEVQEVDAGEDGQEAAEEGDGVDGVRGVEAAEEDEGGG
jgi:hypothetical protein